MLFVMKNGEEVQVDIAFETLADESKAILNDWFSEDGGYNEMDSSQIVYLDYDGKVEEITTEVLDELIKAEQQHLEEELRQI
jgi:hypothetical protein